MGDWSMLMTLSMCSSPSMRRWRPGIVRDISHALAQRRINVVEFHTQVVSAAMTGEPLFKATAQLLAPVDTEIDELRDALYQLAAGLGLDLPLSADADEDR